MAKGKQTALSAKSARSARKAAAPGKKATQVRPSLQGRSAAKAAAEANQGGTKQARIIALLTRGTGATLDELVAATGWLPHTTRAALTGLRHKGFVLDKSKRQDGKLSTASAAVPRPAKRADAMAHEDTALEDEIARLRALDLPGLQARWRTMFGRRTPAHLPRHLLLRIIAYRLQADLHGDLDRATVRSLDRLAKAGASRSAPLPDASSVRPGTLLVREWDGVLHRVMAIDEGFAWNGTSTGACLRLPVRSRARAGTDPASSACAMSPDEGWCQAPALRHLHPGVDRAWAGAGLQLPRRAARGRRGLHQEPGP